MTHPLNETRGTVDDATVTRVINTLRAEGLFDQPPGRPVDQASPRGTASPKPPRPPVGGRAATPLSVRGTRWALFAALLVVAGIGWVVGRGGLPADSQGVDGKPGYAKAPAPGVAQQLQVASPGAEAERLLRLLGELGLKAEVLTIGSGRLVRAAVPPDAYDRAAVALANEGIVLARDGHVAVLFERQRP